MEVLVGERSIDFSKALRGVDVEKHALPHAPRGNLADRLQRSAALVEV